MQATETASESSTERRRRLTRELAEAFASFPRFCGLIDVIDKTGKRVKFRLNRTQRRYVRARTSRDVVLKGRQVGMTTVILALMVYRFLTVPGATVVIVCQAMTDNPSSRKISKNVEIMFDSLEKLGISIPFRTRTTKLWELEGKDSSLQIIEAGASEKAAEKKGRSQTITHLHLTEVGYWEYAEETLRALLKCVPPPELGSEVVFECTANGASGPFYEHCQSARQGEDGYAFHFYPWYVHEEYEVALAPGEYVAPKTDHQRLLVEHHGLTPGQLKWWQREVAVERGDEDHVNQEYPSDPDTCFLVSGKGFFSAPKIAKMLASAAAPSVTQTIRESGFVEMRDGKESVPGLRVWHPPVPGQEYIVICDTSEGVGGSAGCAGVLERRTARHMATIWGQVKPLVLARWSVLLAKKYNGAEIAVERNNHGHAVLIGITTVEKYARVFEDRDERAGWNNTPASRPAALDTFEHAVRDEYFRTNDVQALREMRTFIVDARGKPVHAKGARDDLVMMLAIGYDVICRIAPRRDASDWVSELPAT